MAIRSWSVVDTEGEGDFDGARRIGLWRVVFDLVEIFRVIDFFDFTSLFRCHPGRIRLVSTKLGYPWGDARHDRRSPCDGFTSRNG